MEVKSRREVVFALRAAAAALMGKHFKTTDEMLKWALKHKGEKDPPAPDVETKQTTTDSEIPETFGRVLFEDEVEVKKSLDEPDLDELRQNTSNWQAEGCDTYDDSRDICLDKVAARKG